MGKVILGLLAGAIAFMAVLVALEWMAHQVSGPAGTTVMFAIVILAYFLSAFIGGFVAARISDRGWTAWAIAALVIAGVIWTIIETRIPLWMQIGSLVAPLLGGFLAHRLFARRPVAEGGGRDG